MVHLDPSTNAVEGVAVAINGTASSSDGEVPTVWVDFGDGTPLQRVAVSNGAFHLAHIYVDEGDGTIVTTASSSHGTSRATSQLTISEYHATVSLPAHADAPGGVLSVGGSVVDPSTDTEFAMVDYGDGAGPQQLAVNGRQFQLQHQYQQPSGSPTSYTVKITFRDEDGPGPTVTLGVSITASSA
jgi:PKD repeat protein